jgi:predicted NUDIX family NTP pyrophosphohydrolase
MVRKCCSFIPLGHTGWRKKDDGAWSIPKGEIDASEDPEQAARREFGEELGPAACIGRCEPW